MQKPWLGACAIHAHVPAQGQQGDAIFSVASRKAEEFGPKAQREGQHPHAAELGDQEVAELVNGDEHAKKDEGCEECHIHSIATEGVYGKPSCTPWAKPLPASIAALASFC